MEGLREVSQTTANRRATHTPAAPRRGQSLRQRQRRNIAVVEHEVGGPHQQLEIVRHDQRLIQEVSAERDIRGGITSDSETRRIRSWRCCCQRDQDQQRSA